VQSINAALVNYNLTSMTEADASPSAGSGKSTRIVVLSDNANSPKLSNLPGSSNSALYTVNHARSSSVLD